MSILDTYEDTLRAISLVKKGITILKHTYLINDEKYNSCVEVLDKLEKHETSFAKSHRNFL